jgi:hypothetical protein
MASDEWFIGIEADDVALQRLFKKRYNLPRHEIPNHRLLEERLVRASLLGFRYSLLPRFVSDNV